MIKFVATLMSGLLANPAVAQGASATKTITGQLIDIGNYAAGYPLWEYAGVHARACALQGFDVGLLTSDGEVYYVKGELAANSNAKLLNYMFAPEVTITGEVSEKDGLMTIEGSDVKCSNCSLPTREIVPWS